jgi:hypothetical protein
MIALVFVTLPFPVQGGKQESSHDLCLYEALSVSFT